MNRVVAVDDVGARVMVGVAPHTTARAHALSGRDARLDLRFQRPAKAAPYERSANY